MPPRSPPDAAIACCAEFGITKALVKCDEKLRPMLPRAEAPASATLELQYADEDLILVRASGEGLEEGSLTLVLSRVSDETMEVARARRG